MPRGQGLQSIKLILDAFDAGERQRDERLQSQANEEFRQNQLGIEQASLQATIARNKALSDQEKARRAHEKAVLDQRVAEAAAEQTRFDEEFDAAERERTRQFESDAVARFLKTRVVPSRDAQGTPKGELPGFYAISDSQMVTPGGNIVDIFQDEADERRRLEAEQGIESDAAEKLETLKHMNELDQIAARATEARNLERLKQSGAKNTKADPLDRPLTEDQILRYAHVGAKAGSTLRDVVGAIPGVFTTQQQTSQLTQLDLVEKLSIDAHEILSIIDDEGVPLYDRYFTGIAEGQLPNLKRYFKGGSEIVAEEVRTILSNIAIEAKKMSEFGAALTANELDLLNSFIVGKSHTETPQGAAAKMRQVFDFIKEKRSAILDNVRKSVVAPSGARPNTLLSPEQQEEINLIIEGQPELTPEQEQEQADKAQKIIDDIRARRTPGGGG